MSWIYADWVFHPNSRSIIGNIFPARMHDFGVEFYLFECRLVSNGIRGFLGRFRGIGMNIIDYPQRRRTLMLVASVLILLLTGAGFATFLFWPGFHSHTPNANAATNATNTPVAGVRMLDLALNKATLTSLFSTQLAIQNSPLSNIQVTPMPNNVLVLTLDRKSVV